MSDGCFGEDKREISAPLIRARTAPTTPPPSAVRSGTNGSTRPSVGTVSGILIVPANHRVAHSSCYKRFCAIKVSFLARYDEIKDRHREGLASND